MIQLGTKLAADSASFPDAVRAGFGHVELSLDPVTLEAPEAVLQLKQRYGLDFSLHFPNRGRLSDQQIKNCVDLYRSLNASCLVIHEPMFQIYGSALHELAGDLVIGVENHRLTPEELVTWARLNPGLTLDVEHFWMHSHPEHSCKQLLKSLGRFLEDFADRIRQVHLPGHLPEHGTHRPMYCSRDFVFGVLDLLDASTFSATVISETSARFHNELEMRMDVLLFQRWNELLKQAAEETRSESSKG